MYENQKDSLKAKNSSYELISIINNKFNEWKKENENLVFVGHNFIKFDSTCLEYNLFNNLYFPYIDRKNRGDTLNLARALYALNPSSIKTPLTKTVNIPINIKVIVAMIDLIEKRLIPLIPCPLVQPLLNFVPKPTKTPAIINKITELEIDIIISLPEIRL